MSDITENNNIINNNNSVEKKKKKKKAPRCNLEGCNKPQSIIVGNCKWCNLHFCNTHRLPESHCCTQLNDCKNSAFNINQNKLEKEKTTCRKVEII